MMTRDTQSSPLVARRKKIVMKAESGRVITRLYMPGTEQHSRNVIRRVLSLDDVEVSELLERILGEFSHRHRRFRQTLEENFQKVSIYVDDAGRLSPERRLLIGAFFTAEYSIEAAALFNPSMVQVPSLPGDEEGSCRFVMSFRATGEGHISSIEFRSGIIDANNDIYFDPVSRYVDTPEIHPNPRYDRHLFRLKLHEMGAENEVTHQLLLELPEIFTLSEIEMKIDELKDNQSFSLEARLEAIDMALWLAQSNYEMVFRPDHPISERVIFPVSESERKGIEDARFVRFVDDDGEVTYYATYTAYNGETILPHIIETRDFLSFKVITLNGRQAQGKGMALFPRRINGKYAMLSRQDGESNTIMFSDNLHFWQEAQLLQEPAYPFEFIQMGNAGSPIETPEGWLVLTHGVGPMRTYSLGIELLDLDDPTRIIARIPEPILTPSEFDREGYVPNVVYSCGSIVHGGQLIIPYASADQRSGIATLELDEVMARLGRG